MDVLILAAGYATRLYPLTQTKAKPLLPVAGKPMIEYVIDNLATIEGLGRVYVVTNDKFAKDFEAWAAGYTGGKLDFKIINDGSTSTENAKGAIGDIHFTLKQEGLSNDLIVVAGDNLFNRTLEDFGRMARAKNEALLAVYDVGNLEEIKKYNNISIDDSGKIIAFEEKPKNPTGTKTGIALYFYPKHILPMIDQYIAEGNNPDQPGRFVQWLYPRKPVYTWDVPGLWLDIGSKETLEEADRLFSKG